MRSWLWRIPVNQEVDEELDRAFILPIVGFKT